MHPINGKQSLPKSFKSALHGFIHAATQRNFRILIICGIAAYAVLTFFEVPMMERLVVLTMTILTIVGEIFNTAIEELSDALVQEHHPAIAKVKELTAAAVLLLSITTGLITLYVLIPAL